MTSIDGVVTGFDTTAIIDSLLAAERIPQNQLVVQKSVAEAKADVFADLRGRYDAVRTAAKKLDLPDDWARLAATSSDELVTVSAGSGSITGAVSFSVLQRASAHAVYSTDTVSSLDAIIAPGGGFLTASGYEPLGFSSLVGNGLAEGVQTFEVTQDSAAAITTGDAPLPTNLTITSANDRVRLRVNGVQRNVDIPDGTYVTQQDLVDAVNVGISNVGDFNGKVTARLGAGGEIEFVTTREGSEATIRVTGGDARTDLNLSNDPSDLVGTDGVVRVNGIDTTITNTDTGTGATLDAGTGTVDVVFAGGLRTGTADLENVSFGTGTLTDVVDSINARADFGTKAAIIQVDEGEYRLQLTATDTGDDSSIDLDLGQFTGLSGGFTTLSTGQDAVLQVEGANPYTIRSSSNTFTDLLPGVDVSVTGMPTGSVTVDVTRDIDEIANRVQGLVDAINDVLTGFEEVSSYDPETDEASLMTGSSTIRRARDELTSAFLGPVAGASLGSIGLTGVQLQNDGTFEFDKAAFVAAYEADPAAVERVYAVEFDSEDDSAVGRLLTEIEDATAFGTGYLRTAEDSEKARVEDLNQSIAAWDRRLEVREQVLRGIYTRLETSLAQLQSQSTWLAGQIATLTTPSTET